MTNEFRRSNTTAAKLSPVEVLMMRQRYNEGWTQGRLAREYRISVGQVGRIVRNEVWTSLLDDHALPRGESELRSAQAMLIPQSEIDASLKKLNEMMGVNVDGRVASDSRPPLPDLDLPNGSGLARLTSELVGLKPQEVEKVENELEEFLK